MGIHWTSLFIMSQEVLSAPAIADAVLNVLLAEGYRPYNPFGLMPGKTYADSIRLFVAPAQQQIVRILSDNPNLPPTVLDAATQNRMGIFCHLNADDYQLLMFQDGQSILNEDVTRESGFPVDGEGQLNAVSFLPHQYRALANRVDVNKAQNMIGRFAGELVGKAGGDMDSAQALLQASQPVDWNTPHAQQLQSSINRVLGISTWQMPDFATLRDAYSLYKRRERKPDARLLPGDDTVMQAVPNALDYIPIYVGR